MDVAEGSRPGQEVVPAIEWVSLEALAQVGTMSGASRQRPAPVCVVVDAGGQLGIDLAGLLRAHPQVVPLTYEKAQGCDLAQVRAMVHEYRPHVMLNTAASYRIDDCEREVERISPVDAVVVRYLTEACWDRGVMLVQPASIRFLTVVGKALAECSQAPGQGSASTTFRRSGPWL